MGLGPEETHWPIEKFQKYSEEDFVKDVFEDGYVDVGIFQSTYLKEWYREGFNTLEKNAELVEKYPDRLIANGRWDPREGDAGLKQLEEDAERYNLKGVKLYTAEWYQGSRGWSLKSPESQRFLEKCQELGITNIHVHKGPTIWPLDKDAFDVSDVDYVATNFPELNFIVEHVGLPRIEDFCFMATQEPNVYAGLAVVIGGLMHTRTRVLEALSEVHDPELDEPITSLGFVTSCAVSPAGDVEILLRLPTPQCAPNFAYLMAADARNVLRRLPEVGQITVRLDDHYTGEEINAAIARGEGFTGAFPGETDDDQLDALRELFQRKALVARQGRLCEALLAEGATAEQVAALRVADLPDVADTRRCLELRRGLGIDCD